MPPFKVLITDYAWPDLGIERELIESAGGELIEASDTSSESLAEAAREVDAIATCWAQLPADVIDAATQCRIVARFGIGLDNIDVQRCTERGIPVTNLPDYCQVEVAEHALGLIFSLARGISMHHHATKTGQYDLGAALPLYRLEGKVLGILGYGRIGRALARKATALGMRVVTDSNQQEIEPAGRCGTREELLQRSDFLSLHLPLTAETERTIGRSELRRMKPTAHLINTARGGLIDHDALEEAVLEGWIAGAGLDVHDPEPADLSRPLYRHPRVLATPHSAFVSEQSLRDLRRRTIEQVLVRLRGDVPMNVVNPEIL